MFADKAELIQFFESKLPNIADLGDILLQNFGITHFWYDIFLPGEKYLCIGNDLHWKRFFFERDFFNISNFLIEGVRNSPLNSMYYISWVNHNMNDHMLIAARKFNIGNGISIVFRTSELIEIYSFATTVDNEKINDFYMRNIDLIKSFIFYSKKKLLTILNISAIKKFGQLYNNELFSRTPVSYEWQLKIEDFLQEIQNLEIEKNKERALSKRELECVKYLSLSKDEKEVKKILGLSSEAMATYFKIIKNEKNIYVNDKFFTNFLKDNSNLLKFPSLEIMKETH